MNIKPIKTNRDYKTALKRVDELFNSKPNTPLGDELDILITLVEAYEQKHFFIQNGAAGIKAIGYCKNDWRKKQGF